MAIPSDYKFKVGDIIVAATNIHYSKWDHALIVDLLHGLVVTQEEYIDAAGDNIIHCVRTDNHRTSCDISEWTPEIPRIQMYCSLKSSLPILIIKYNRINFLD